MTENSITKNNNINENIKYNKSYQILNTCMELEVELYEDKYNLILEFINEFLKSYNFSYIRLTQLKNINNKYFIATNENIDILNTYVDKFIDNKFILNKKSKCIHNPIYVIKNVLNQIKYKLKKTKNVYNQIQYSIVKN